MKNRANLLHNFFAHQGNNIFFAEYSPLFDGISNPEDQRSVYKYGGKKGDFMEKLPKLIEERSNHGCGYYINEKNEVVLY